jgi:DNA-binding LacI/PurR family transcriptional regulator
MIDGRRLSSIDELAKLAGVSKSTVSRALNDSQLIAKSTREKIQALAKEHNFSVNAAARALSEQASKTIGFATCAHKEDLGIHDLFTLEVMGGLAKGLHEQGYYLMTLQVNPHSIDWAREYIDSGRVDAFVMMTALDKPARLEEMAEAGLPFIAWGKTDPRFCTVRGDDFRGGYLAGKHLAERGRKRVAMIAGVEDEVETQTRLAGFRKALREAGLELGPEMVRFTDYRDESAIDAALDLMRKKGPDAFFVGSDIMAISVMRELTRMGAEVPEEVAIVGYDDLSVSEYCSPTLTTVRQGVNKAGRVIARDIVRYLQTGIVTGTVLPVELVQRESS